MQLFRPRFFPSKSIPADQHFQLKKQLRDLLRRHNEYRNVLLGANMNQVAIGDLSFASVTQAPGALDRFDTSLPNYSYMEAVSILLGNT